MVWKPNSKIARHRISEMQITPAYQRFLRPWKCCDIARYQLRITRDKKDMESNTTFFLKSSIVGIVPVVIGFILMHLSY